jgi:hypothetical protein
MESMEDPRIQADPELAAARELLIRQMCGRSFFELGLPSRAALTVFYLVCWFASTLVLTLFCGFAILVFGVLIGSLQGPHCGVECEQAWAALIINGGMLIGAVLSAASVLYVACRNERQIKRLRRLTHPEFLRAVELWRVRREARAAGLARMEEIDYAASRTAYWSRYYADRA